MTSWLIQFCLAIQNLKAQLGYLGIEVDDAVEIAEKEDI